MSCNKNTKVPDPQFLSHEALDKMPCVASDRYLQKVPEFVKIVNICQDENNTSLVYIEFQLNGVFDYTPRISAMGNIGCKILRVDDDESYADNKVVAPIMLNYFRSVPKTLPLNTKCKTATFILCFDFGRVIPNFLAAKVVHLELRMEGILPKRLNFQKFQTLQKSVSDIEVWQKGPTPNPYRLHYDAGRQRMYVYFQFEQGIPCNCNILCESITGVPQSIQYCEDKTSRVIVDYIAGADPGSLLFQFSDGFGNNSDLSVQPLINTLPEAPSTIPAAKPRRVEVGITRTSVGSTKLDDGVAYQIWKYDESISSARIWKDWSYRNYSSFTDTEVIPGRVYGYAVRYQGKFGEESRISGWSTVVV